MPGPINVTYYMIVEDDDVDDDDAQPMTTMMIMVVVGVMTMMIVCRCSNSVYHLLHYSLHLYPPIDISTYSSLSFYPSISSSSLK